ncbi:hypothetical protein J6590_075335 [Homalodisca vitripennis]|nr:hypothetical protein J6590_075335 [Homalodisca vitripennis]
MVFAIVLQVIPPETWLPYRRRYVTYITSQHKACRARIQRGRAQDSRRVRPGSLSGPSGCETKREQLFEREEEEEELDRTEENQFQSQVSAGGR